MDSELAKQLIGMAEEDQRQLKRLFESGELPSEHYHPAMQSLHEKNVASLKSIIDKHGWPGISLVGPDAAKAAWLITQHSVSNTQFMSDAALLMSNAHANDDIEGWQLAFLEDRLQTLSGKDQIYGTQFDVDADGWPIPFPIADPEGVDKRRRALGLNTLEERLQEMVSAERRRREQESSS
ncbi:hypothetical protein BOW53_12055 [Solemya pervernicosa gill symbiont]|uniref:Uncharacterized protein n=1 Tax=Solemya pervernicosa gill symbiont TaxID=642797 RepID=A0A1T2L2I7_9GAMM|nr:DUF6624 domain-containing protein [Solemya pervernicosa gill symbiont]OOZ39292.1 hypothetical protein BOW53_12055 [Solemya pervernicosa gill symbiont]